MSKEKPHFPTYEERHAMLMYVNNKIISEGMTREEYLLIKDKPVGIGWTVKSFIEASMGEVEWIDGKLTYMGQLVIIRQK